MTDLLAITGFRLCRKPDCKEIARLPHYGVGYFCCEHSRLLGVHVPACANPMPNCDHYELRP